MQDLHELPKLRDSLSYLYVEHAILDKKQQAVEYVQQDGRTLIPTANLSVLMLGPGTSITHAAINTLARSGCTVLWTGQDATRFYAQASREYDVPWHGRKYDRGRWGSADPINRALSAANALLNGLCHAAIVSGGYSPGLGFIHTGKQLSFVYDIADLYKADITIPTAFATVAESEEKVESRVRAACREKFKETKLLQRILPDIDDLLDLQKTADTPTIEGDGDVDADPALPTEYWDRIEGKKGGQDDHHDS